MWYTRAPFWNFILEFFVLVLALNSYCGDKKIKYELRSNHLFQRAQEHDSWIDVRVLVNFYKNWCLPVITWTKKDLLKQAVTTTCTLEKTFYCSSYFWRFVSRFFFSDRVKKLVVYLVCITLLWISGEDKTKWMSFMRGKLVFRYVDG